MEASRGNSFFGCEMALSVWDGAGMWGFWGTDEKEIIWHLFKLRSGQK